jgi:hypothetical protein
MLKAKYCYLFYLVHFPTSLFRVKAASAPVVFGHALNLRALAVCGNAARGAAHAGRVARRIVDMPTL